MAHAEWHHEGFTISTDPARLDRALIMDFLAGTYWGQSIPRDRLERSIDHALVFGLYEAGGGQVGFGRVVTDYARFAWLSDVFVLEAWRGRGLGKWLVETILAHEPLAGVTRWLLATRDAHALYRPLGFTEAPQGRFMVRPGFTPPPPG
jgi:GNAT superfamily N-acetyltransferase